MISQIQIFKRNRHDGGRYQISNSFSFVGLIRFGNFKSEFSVI